MSINYSKFSLFIKEEPVEIVQVYDPPPPGVPRTEFSSTSVFVNVKVFDDYEVRPFDERSSSLREAEKVRTKLAKISDIHSRNATISVDRAAKMKKLHITTKYNGAGILTVELQGHILRRISTAFGKPTEVMATLSMITVKKKRNGGEILVRSLPLVQKISTRRMRIDLLGCEFYGLCTDEFKLPHAVTEELDKATSREQGPQYMFGEWNISVSAAGFVATPSKHLSQAEKCLNLNKSILDSLMGADMKIISDSGEVFPCHSGFVSAQLPRLMQEATVYCTETKTATLRDMGPQAIKWLIRYLYQGDVVFVESEKTANELIKFGKRYGLDDFVAELQDLIND